MFTQKSGSKSNVLKYRGVCLEISVFNTLTWVPIVPQSPSSPPKAIFPIPVKCPLNKGKRWNLTAD